jgi:predicted metal-dependent phosphoesterase TrpH
MIRLKADLHTHSGDDREDRISYSSEQLIDCVAGQGYRVLAITGHQHLTFRKPAADYARERGVLLVPGCELLIEGGHVVILNPDGRQASAQSFAELRSLGRRDAAIIAPHPFYPLASLGKKLVENIDLFDAVEYCSFYFRGINPNRKAVCTAMQHGLPLLGTSDCHMLPHADSTFSWIEAEEATVPGIIDAIRAGRIRLVTRPIPLGYGIKLTAFQLALCAQFAMRWLRA